MDITLEELLKAGVHFGHQTKRWDPRMAPYIYGAREGIHIFDLAKTREALLLAYDAVKKKVAEGGVILLVGTKRQAQGLIADLGKKVGMPYVNKRWLGGFLTNFEQIQHSIKKLEELKSQKEAGVYKNYTKKERLLIEKEIARLERLLEGVSLLKSLPDMLFIVDVHHESTALSEAVKKNIPTVAIVDSNSNPTNVDYPIPANDDAVKSISLILDVIGKAIEAGLKAREKEVKK